MTISEQLRETVERCGETHYRIGKEADVDISVVDRFVSGERPNITAQTIDRLCDYLGLELCSKRPRQKAARKTKRGAKKK